MKKPPPSDRPAPARGRASSPALAGWLLLAFLAWPAPAPAQDPPPLDVFTLEDPQPSGQAGGGDANLTDFFLEAAEGADLRAPATPPLPPAPAGPPPLPPPTQAAAAPPAPAPAPRPPAAQTGQMPAEMDFFDLSDEAAELPPAPPASGAAAPPPTSPSIPPAAPVQPPAPVQLAVPPAPSPPGTGYLNFDDLIVPADAPPAPAVPAVPPAPEPALSPFQDPLPAGPAPTPMDSPPLPPLQVESVSVPLGQGALPPPQWATATESNLNPSQFVSGTAIPQFDSSQGQWLQLEVGQADAGLQPAVKPAARPTSVSTIPGAAPPLPPAGAAPTPPPAAAPASAVDAAMDQALASAPASRPLEPAEREKLRQLFSDMLPPDSLGARAPVTAQSAPGRPAGQTTVSQAAPDALKPAPSAPALPPSAPAAAEDEGISAILKAGGLLTLDSQAGAAEILPPGAAPPKGGQTAAPAKPAAAPPKAERPQAGPAVKPAPAEKGGQAAPAAKPPPARKSGSRKKAAAPQPAPVTKAGLTIVNETGQNRLGETYRSVLSKMGYSVVSATDKPARGRSAGQTVIRYRPGYLNQAQSVARHLPGKKVLVEARGDQASASAIMIHLR